MKPSLSQEQMGLLRGSLSSLGLIVAGIILLTDPDFGSAAVTSLLGWGLLGIGVLGIVVGLASWPVLGLKEMIASGVALALGIYILNNPLILATLLGLGLGIYLLATGLGSLQDALKLRQIGANASASLVLAVAQLVVGVVLLLSPRIASHVVLTVCGGVMVLCGIVRLVLRSATYRALHSGDKPDIIDAEE